MYFMMYVRETFLYYLTAEDSYPLSRVVYPTGQVFGCWLQSQSNLEESSLVFETGCDVFHMERGTSVN